MVIVTTWTVRGRTILTAAMLNSSHLQGITSMDPAWAKGSINSISTLNSASHIAYTEWLFIFNFPVSCLVSVRVCSLCTLGVAWFLGGACSLLHHCLQSMCMTCQVQMQRIFLWGILFKSEFR
ncbi:hypothetical protein DFH27DRAFT_564869 [Peziza echinospora]|nr:hypothetical protein DFH27DRAFT_564869 [Peziza echinospora]